jgi:prepilin-type N-terminal cleavage/methylation domain-containing protein
MFKNRQNQNQKGFTLVELSIVLVIIGLIISSVLVGQDLIRSAELRATVTQYEGFNSAVATFRGKYSGLPGDVAGATNFGFTGDGNGDGALVASTALSTENVYFWNHLGSSGAALISGTYAGTAVDTDAGGTAGLNDNTPTNKSGLNWGVFGASGINYYIVGVVGGTTAGDYDTTDFLTPLDARNIDEKVDDAMPNRGIVHARNGAADANTAADTNCVSATTVVGIYDTTQTGTNCTLRLKFQL